MLLLIDELTKEFKRGKDSFLAVDHVNLAVNAGDFVSIIGRSGSGKSTLLNLIAGLLNPTSGRVIFEDEDIADFSDAKSSYLRNSLIGYIPQGQNILPNLSVLDNITLPFYLAKRKGKPSEKAISLMKEVGIFSLKDSLPKELSGGELRRVAIVRALINEPKIIIADEPTSDLDAETTQEIMKLLLKISERGVAILLVTHELDTTDYGNRKCIMNAGTLCQTLNY